MSVFDSFALSRGPLEGVSNDDYAKVDNRLGMFAVADGVGGRPGGARASKVAVETFFSRLISLPASQRLDLGVLRDAVQAANEEVHAVGKNHPDLSGLGTTLSTVVLNGSKGKLVHVGDSRVYLFRRQSLVQLTRDHTVAAELVEQQRISSESAKQHPLRHMLSRSIGRMATDEADIEDIELLSNDRLILVTDGLTKAVETVELSRILSNSGAAATAEDMCRAMVSAAMLRSPTDDVTAVVACFLKDGHGGENSTGGHDESERG